MSVPTVCTAVKHSKHKVVKQIANVIGEPKNDSLISATICRDLFLDLEHFSSCRQIFWTPTVLKRFQICLPILSPIWAIWNTFDS